MKKNSTMRVAALLLALTLMTSCFVGGTFAKYTTAGTGTDSARVAKWGVTVTAPGKTFSNVYKDVATTNASIQTVVSTDKDSNGEYDKVIAPGTEGTLSMFEVTGKPEVDVRVSYEAQLNFEGTWLVDYNDDDTLEAYCPVVITVVYNGNTTVFSMKDYTTIAALEEAVENYINVQCAVVYDANTDLTTVNDDLTISWKWFFENTTPGNPLKDYQNDNADTDLGNIIADEDASTDDPTITFIIKCTITQVD